MTTTGTRPLFADNPVYVEYETRLKELHRLIAEGKGDDEEADAVRDAMEPLYRRLTDAERERLANLSGDLYMLTGEEVYEPATAEERSSSDAQMALEEAWERRDWEKVLALLRRGLTFLPIAPVAFLRAATHEGLGHIDTALLFLRYAACLPPAAGSTGKMGGVKQAGAT